MKRIVKVFFAGFVLLLLFVLATNLWVIGTTKSLIHYNNHLPKNDVALVLGTSRWTQDGRPNRFFVERMNAAAILYRINNVKHILVSGDNRTKHYNEPREMLNALGDLNVPEQDISLDFAGFRTLDSVIRAKEVFGQDAITIVTQEFHCYRSLFIANHFDINAVAYSADDGGPVGLNLAIREILARSFAVIDLYILGRKPKFLGEKIILPIRHK